MRPYLLETVSVIKSDTTPLAKSAPKLLHTAVGGHECDLASTPSGWVLGAVTMEDVDGRFVRNMDVDTEWEHAKALLYPGKTYEDWARAFLSLRPSLNLIESASGTITTLHSVSAEQFSGIAAVGGHEPAFLWTSLDGGRWNVNVHHMGESRLLNSGQEVLLAPSLVRDHRGRLWSAWVSREADGDVVNLVDEAGTTEVRLPGRYPSLSATKTGVAACYERFDEGESHVYLSRVENGTTGEPVRVSFEDPLNFLPRCIEGPNGEVLVTWTSSPAWGFDVRVEQVRSIWLKRVDPQTGRIEDGPATGPGGLMPIPLRSFSRSGELSAAINMTPSNPRLLRDGDGLLCTFRMFQPDVERKLGEPWIVDGRFNRDLRLYHHREGWYLCATRYDGSLVVGAGANHADGRLLAPPVRTGRVRQPSHRGGPLPQSRPDASA